MSDWVSIINARKLDIPAQDVERVTKPLDALEKSFRPLVQDLSADLEPSTTFQAEEDGE